MSKNRNPPPPTATELRAAVDALEASDERAAAVTVAAWVDDALKAVLTNYLSRDEDVARKLLGVDAPLGTFGARIKLAFLLGLLSPDVRKDLDTIRDIRNDFAHLRADVTFGSQSIADRCANLNVIRAFDDARGAAGSEPRFQFVMGACLLAFALIELASKSQPPSVADVDLLAYARRTGRSNPANA